MSPAWDSPGAAVAFALLSWWFGTGAILWLVRLPRRSFGWSLPALSLLGLLGLGAAHLSMKGSGSAAAYLGFASVILMWSWHEMAFLSGWITGPRRIAQSAGARGMRRFVEAVQAVLYHELALLPNLALLWWMQTGQPSHVALCTFALLWCMRFTAKINLFLGVPEVGEQYLPRHLVYLGSYFRRAPVSLFFPLTLGGACLTWAWLIWQAHSGLVSASTGWVLLASLLGLAIVEHVIMLFPVPMQRLWGWAMSRGRSQPTPTVPLGTGGVKPDQA